MTSNQFSERLEEIRKRFAAKLAPKFEETDATLPLLSGAGATSIEAVSATYRRFHEISGTGQTLGFTKLGQAAGKAEAILLEPYRARRALTDIEVGMLKQALEALRAAAQIELQPRMKRTEQKS